MLDLREGPCVVSTQDPSPFPLESPDRPRSAQPDGDEVRLAVVEPDADLVVVPTSAWRLPVVDVLARVVPEGRAAVGGDGLHRLVDGKAHRAALDRAEPDCRAR